MTKERFKHWKDRGHFRKTTEKEIAQISNDVSEEMAGHHPQAALIDTIKYWQMTADELSNQLQEVRTKSVLLALRFAEGMHEIFEPKVAPKTHIQKRKATKKKRHSARHKKAATSLY